MEDDNWTSSNPAAVVTSVGSTATSPEKESLHTGVILFIIVGVLAVITAILLLVNMYIHKKNQQRGVGSWRHEKRRMKQMLKKADGEAEPQPTSLSRTNLALSKPGEYSGSRHLHHDDDKPISTNIFSVNERQPYRQADCHSEHSASTVTPFKGGPGTVPAKYVDSA